MDLFVPYFIDEGIQHVPRLVKSADFRALSSALLPAFEEALGDLFTEDFKSAFSPENAKNFTPTRQLAEGCLVISTLDAKWKRNLLKFFLSHQLAEYSIIFNDGEEAAWLDKIDNRYTWLKRHLMDFEERIGNMFPPDWDVSERIAVEFCDVTRKDSNKQLS